jgi:Ca2+:H+ antiporter
VAAIKGAGAELNLPTLFLGTIVIPIIGNAAEHAAAIIFAYKNKMELSLGIAVGSATQIALFVLPACVCVAWAYGTPVGARLPSYLASLPQNVAPPCVTPVRHSRASLPCVTPARPMLTPADIPLSMDFHPFETLSLLVSVLLVSVFINTGMSNWMQGFVLVVAYAAVAVGYFVHVDVQSGEGGQVATSLNQSHV